MATMSGTRSLRQLNALKVRNAAGFLALFSVLCIPARATASAVTPGQSAPPETVSLQIENNPEGVGGVVLQAYVKADIGAVWSIVTDMKKIQALFPHILAIEFLKNEPSPVDDVVKKLWTYKLSSMLGTKVLQVETTNNSQTHVARWKRVSGELSAFEGKWVLTAPPEYPGYTHILYESFIDGGFFAPQFLTNRLNMQDTQHMIEELRKELR